MQTADEVPVIFTAPPVVGQNAQVLIAGRPATTSMVVEVTAHSSLPDRWKITTYSGSVYAGCLRPEYAEVTSYGMPLTNASSATPDSATDPWNRWTKWTSHKYYPVYVIVILSVVSLFVLMSARNQDSVHFSDESLQDMPVQIVNWDVNGSLVTGDLWNTSNRSWQSVRITFRLIKLPWTVVGERATVVRCPAPHSCQSFTVRMPPNIHSVEIADVELID